MPEPIRKLAAILCLPLYRRMTVGIASAYLLLFLVSLQDISLGGRGVGLRTVDWTRMFERTGIVTFEPVVQLTLPGLTVLISPLNVLIGLVVSVLVGLNLVVTYIASRQPKACSFNRSTGVLASVPALLAGGACCAPAIVLIFGLQLSSFLVGVFQILIPAALILLLVTLKLILDRTNTELLTA